MPLTLTEAINVHAQWRLRLVRFLDTKGASEALDPTVVATDTACDLGKWIHGEGRTVGGQPEFQNLQRLHAEFHKSAAKVVDLARKGEFDQGFRAVDADSPFQKASLDVITALKRLSRNPTCQSFLQQ